MAPAAQNPAMAFPNSHLTRVSSPAATPPASPSMKATDAPGFVPAARGSLLGSAAMVAPQASSHKPTDLLRQAVLDMDWQRAYEEGSTKMQANASWSASAERCSTLQCLVSLHRTERVLEIGSFCGAAALAMAEALPQRGTVTSLELESFFVDFGKKYQSMSKSYSKISTKLGPASDTLKEIVEQGNRGDLKPFDFVVIDGDKASMQEYFDLVRSPGVLTRDAIICLDVTPFKGQPPTRYVRFGAAEKWVSHSGEEEIKALRKLVAGIPEVVSNEFGGLLVIQSRPQE